MDTLVAIYKWIDYIDKLYIYIYCVVSVSKCYRVITNKDSDPAIGRVGRMNARTSPPLPLTPPYTLMLGVI